MHMHKVEFLPADNSQRAYKMSKGVKTVPEILFAMMRQRSQPDCLFCTKVWMAVRMNCTNKAIEKEFVLIKPKLPSVNTPLMY